jgi:chloride channel 7
MLGGVTRMTISITVLAMEGTAALQLIVPLMLAVFVAKMVGDSLTLSIYDVHIKIRGAPVLVRALGSAPVLHAFKSKTALLVDPKP